MNSTWSPYPFARAPRVHPLFARMGAAGDASASVSFGTAATVGPTPVATGSSSAPTNANPALTTSIFETISQRRAAAAAAAAAAAQAAATQAPAGGNGPVPGQLDPNLLLQTAANLNASGDPLSQAMASALLTSAAAINAGQILTPEQQTNAITLLQQSGVTPATVPAPPPFVPRRFGTGAVAATPPTKPSVAHDLDRKSTRLNSSHS